jgi:hypothetical protein
MSKLRAAWEWLHSQDWITWVGHGVQGGLAGLVLPLVGIHPLAAVFAVAFHFGIREVGNAVEAKLTNQARGRKVVDGVMDLLTPVLVAIVVAELVWM